MFASFKNTIEDVLTAAFSKLNASIIWWKTNYASDDKPMMKQ